MPQLMPLNWQFSFMMVMLVIFSACLIYSFKENKMLVLSMSSEMEKEQNMWCW